VVGGWWWVVGGSRTCLPSKSTIDPESKITISSSQMALTKIISGGQTGVDRGALDAALEAGFPCGGWCPKGRLAEDGPIPPHYAMLEMTGVGYEERTLRNALESDGTAILYFGALEGGTRLTKEYCVHHAKPYELVNASRATPQEAARQFASFVQRNRIATLNVAGPRASKWPGARQYAHDTVGHMLKALAGPESF
jgi:hypothetical protein